MKSAAVQKELLHVAYQKAGDSKTLAQLTESYANLVHSQAHKMKAICSEPHEDLYQIGAFGLIKALKKFDPTIGVAFTSFAVPYIRGAMLHHLRDHAPTAKIPRKWHEIYSRCKASEKLGINSVEQAKIARVSQQELALIKQACQLTRRSTKELPDYVVADSAVSDFNYTVSQERLQCIAANMLQLFNSLPNEKRQIIKLLYVDNLSLEKAARKLKKHHRTLLQEATDILTELAAQSVMPEEV